jgi:hypothetical protein
MDPNSARSDARGVVLTALPADGFDGEPPEFPLPGITRWVDTFVDKVKSRDKDEQATDAFRDRELAVWDEVWRTPQAAAWSIQSWRWPIAGEYCRLKTVIELEPDANASLVGQLHRYRDQLGLTPAGLKENGWAIAVDEVAAKAAERQSESEGRRSSRDRMKVVGGSG